jgi:hypothetical protein
MESFGRDLDIFLRGLYPEFEAIEDQGQKSIEQLKKAFIVGTDPNVPSLFLQKNYVNEQIARFVYITGVGKLGKRSVGGTYPEVKTGKRGFITQVEFDPNDEDAGMISISEEFRDRLNPAVREKIATAQGLMNRAIREIWKGYFDLLEHAFTQPSNYPSHLFARGNSADNPNGPLNVPLMSSHHPLVNSSAEGVNVLTDSPALSEEALFRAFALGGDMVDDWGEKMPIGFGTGFTLIIPNNPEMVPVALQLVGAEKQPYTSDNNVNLIKGILGNVLISNLLTGSKWFIVANNDRDPLFGAGLIDVTFVPLTVKGPVVNEDTDSVVWKLKYQKRWGWVDWRYIIGSLGNSQPYTL